MTRPEPEQIARWIAEGIGVEYDTLYADKREWTKDRGRRHDLNFPYKGDLLDAAKLILERWPA